MEDIERLTRVEESTKSAHKRIDEHDREINKLSDFYVALTKVDSKVDGVVKDMSEVKDDLKVIKDKPAKRLDGIITTIITRHCYGNTGIFISKNWIIKIGGK